MKNHLIAAAALALSCSTAHARLPFGNPPLEPEGFEAQIPAVSAKPVQRRLTEVEKLSLEIQLKAAASEAQPPSIRRSAVINLKAFVPGPQDKRIMSTLSGIIEGTPVKAKYAFNLDEREELTSAALALLAGAAETADRGDAAEAIETMGRLLPSGRTHARLQATSIEMLEYIAIKREAAADRVLAHLAKTIDSDAYHFVKDRALKAVAFITERSKARAADPVPGPVKLERIP